MRMPIRIRKRRAVSAKTFVALMTLACAGSLQAHHSGYMYEQTPIWVRGAVVRIDHVNPHTLITLEDRSEPGQVLRWAVEGPGQSQLERMGRTMDVPKVGDVVEFCAFPYKPPAELSRIFPGVDFSRRRAASPADGASPRFVAGHVMVMSDGEKRFWEPHGVISECIRNSDEPRQSWVDFLDADPRAREAWCMQRNYPDIQTSPALMELVEGINGVIDEPCA